MTDTSIVDDEIDPPELDDLDDAPEPDEPETDPPEDDPDPGEAEPEPIAAEKSRRPASEVIRAEKRGRKEAEERATRLEREMAELRTMVTQPRMSEAEIYRQQQAEQERLQLMSPEERIDYRAQQSEMRLQREMQSIRYTAAETADKAAFRALQSTDPLAKKYAAQVEERFAEQVKMGKPVEREVLLDLIVGKAMRERAASASTKQGKAGKARVAAAEGRPARAGGDTGSERANRGGEMSEAEFERRYANVKF